MGEFILVPQEKIRELEAKIDKLLSIVTDNAGKSRQIGDWIPEKEAQAMLGFKATTLWSMRRRGQIKSRKIGSKVYYSIDSIRKLLETGKG